MITDADAQAALANAQNGQAMLQLEGLGSISLLQSTRDNDPVCYFFNVSVGGHAVATVTFPSRRGAPALVTANDGTERRFAFGSLELMVDAVRQIVNPLEASSAN